MKLGPDFFLRATLVAVLPSLAASAGWAQAAPGHAQGQYGTETRFSVFPGLPACAPGSVKSGDPAKGPSIILAKADSGCVIPWHWHSPNEHLMMVRGAARVDMKDGKPLVLKVGDYAMLPGKHVHRFVCTSSCLFYVHSDAAFDIHYVNDKGEEISPQEALKPRAKPADLAKQS
jgi:quercetin dioxygenase-like cupin family protein